MNAVKHGLTGHLPTSFDDVDVGTLTQQLSAEFGVEGTAASMVLERLVVNYVRLRRAAKLEANLIESVLDPPSYEEVPGIDIFGGLDELLPKRVLIDPGTARVFQKEDLDYLVRCVDRYCTSSENKFYRALRVLMELRGKRRGFVSQDQL